ncbi:MAG: MFS transporter [Acidobacteriota bacterium]|nr:MFS transporter [Acidobacteriota bacterium]
MIGTYALVGAANQMLWLTFTPITTPSAHHYGVSSSDIGWLAEIFPLLYVLLAVPAASLLDRWFRPVLAVGAVLTAAGGVLRLGGDTFAWALAGQVLIAVAQPLILNAVTGLASGYLSARSRPLGIAIGSAGIFLGMLLSLALGSAIGGAHLHTLLVIDAVFAVVTTVAMLVTFALSPGMRVSGDVTGMSGLGTVWREPGIRYLAMVSFIGFGLFVALTTWLQTLLKPAGISASTAGWVLVGAVVAGVVGAATLPAAVIRARQDHLLFRAASLGTCGACVLFAVWKWVPAVFAGAAVIGFLMLAALPVILEISERRAGPAGTSATALIWLCGNAGGIVIAILVQIVVHRPTVAFLLMAAIAILVLRLVWQGSLSGAAAELPDAAPS